MNKQEIKAVVEFLAQTKFPTTITTINLRTQSIVPDPKPTAKELEVLASKYFKRAPRMITAPRSEETKSKIAATIVAKHQAKLGK